MKRFIYIALSLMALATACTKEAPTDGDRLYHRYASREDLTVAQVRGFHLADTVKVDVVLLVADDSAAWQGLKEELDIRTTEGVTSWLGDIDEPARRVKRSEVPLWRVMAVHDDRTVALYRVESAAQFDALRDYQLDRIECNK
ncbi:MAG: hypothetical protein IJ524_05380 [Bacteroidales bacterium]|nr:hypothetical protein [Bacteroidales bacterium]